MRTVPPTHSVFLSSNYALQIDLSDLMRGDYAARWAANEAAVQAGILLPDEVDRGAQQCRRGRVRRRRRLTPLIWGDAVTPGDGGD